MATLATFLTSGRREAWSVAVGDFNSDFHNVSVPLNQLGGLRRPRGHDRRKHQRGQARWHAAPRSSSAAWATTASKAVAAHLVCGGSDNDHVAGGRGHDRLLGQTGNDGLAGGPGRDLLRGGSGHDRLLGEGGNDRLFGGPSRDLVRGESGNDHPSGGVGKDRILARDWRREVVDCGAGRDVAIVDRHDRRRRCETVGRG